MAKALRDPATASATGRSLTSRPSARWHCTRCSTASASFTSNRSKKSPSPMTPCIPHGATKSERRAVVASVVFCSTGLPLPERPRRSAALQIPQQHARTARTSYGVRHWNAAAHRQNAGRLWHTHSVQRLPLPPPAPPVGAHAMGIVENIGPRRRTSRHRPVRRMCSPNTVQRSQPELERASNDFPDHLTIHSRQAPRRVHGFAV